MQVFTSTNNRYELRGFCGREAKLLVFPRRREIFVRVSVNAGVDAHHNGSDHPQRTRDAIDALCLDRRINHDASHPRFQRRSDF